MVGGRLGGSYKIFLYTWILRAFKLYVKRVDDEVALKPSITQVVFPYTLGLVVPPLPPSNV